MGNSAKYVQTKRNAVLTIFGRKHDTLNYQREKYMTVAPALPIVNNFPFYSLNGMIKAGLIFSFK